MRHRLREEMQIEFTIQNGELFILDGVRVNRRANAAMRIAVKLAEDGIIPQQEALMRIDPRAVGDCCTDRSTQRRNAMFWPPLLPPVRVPPVVRLFLMP